MTFVSGATPQTLQFDFSETPIPINATDLKLQVVYRGPLGDEQDAVVVETVDINEPNFTAYINVTDNLLCVANQWYVRGADGKFHDANGQVATNVDTYGSTIMDDVQIAYEPNDREPEMKPLISIPRVDVSGSTLDPNQYIRFAVLAPLNTKWNIHWKVDGVDKWRPNNILPSDLTTLANQVYVAPSGIGHPPVLTKRAREVIKARNIYAGAGQLIFGGDGSDCDKSNVPADQLPPPEMLRLNIAFP